MGLSDVGAVAATADALGKAVDAIDKTDPDLAAKAAAETGRRALEAAAVIDGVVSNPAKTGLSFTSAGPTGPAVGLDLLSTPPTAPRPERRPTIAGMTGFDLSTFDPAAFNPADHRLSGFGVATVTAAAGGTPSARPVDRSGDPSHPRRRDQSQEQCRWISLSAPRNRSAGE